MRKVLSVILAVVFCVCLTRCGGSEIPSIYRRVIPEFIPKLGSMTFDEAKAFAENNGFGFNKFTMNEYSISDAGIWRAYIRFSDEIVEEFVLSNYNTNQSINSYK